MGIPYGVAPTNGHGHANGHVSSRAAEYNLPSHFIGGNHLSTAVPSKVKDFVAHHEGHSVISSVSFFFNQFAYLLTAYLLCTFLLTFTRFSLPIMVLLLLKKSDQ